MNAPRGGPGGSEGAALRIATVLRRGWVVFLLFAGLGAQAAVFQTAPGRYEISAVDASGAQWVTALADEAWRALAPALDLPAAFPSPIFVRLIPASEWREPAPFHTVVETGGVVTLRVAWGTETRPEFVRRGLVQALLMRLAVAHHGVRENLTAPLWLEIGCVGWWQTRVDGAQLDEWKQASERITPPALGALLDWQRGAAEDPAWLRSAPWLLAHLQAESNRGAEWFALLRRLLGGEEPQAALAASYPNRFGETTERELWWQTGYHHLRRVRSRPTLSAAESRAALEESLRFVAVAGDEDRDRLIPLADVLAHGAEPFVRAELQRRAGDLGRVLPALHPFFRNAGLSLAEAFATRRAEACAVFERDWRDALELQAAATTALEALENSRARHAPRP